MKKFLVLICAITLALGTVGLANATTITFSEVWSDVPQSSRTLVGDEWSSYGILISNAYWYADYRDPWTGQHGISNEGIAVIDFIAPTNSVTFDWLTLAREDIWVEAYNSADILLDSFYYYGRRGAGTDTVSGPSIAYLTFHDTSGRVAISTLNFESVPEPATLLLFGTGLVGLAFARRKIKK